MRSVNKAYIEQFSNSLSKAKSVLKGENGLKFKIVDFI